MDSSWKFKNQVMVFLWIEKTKTHNFRELVIVDLNYNGETIV